MTGFSSARALALAVPVALMAGALGSQYWGGLFPCEICWWQRYAHFAAIGVATLAFLVKPPVVQKTLVALAALALLTSGGIGGWHAGIEWKWWPGLPHCSSPGGHSLEEIMAGPLFACDEAQWRLFGISLAGYNFLISTAVGLFILRLIARKPT